MCPNWIFKKGQNDARPQDKIENNEKKMTNFMKFLKKLKNNDDFAACSGSLLKQLSVLHFIH